MGRPADEVAGRLRDRLAERLPEHDRTVERIAAAVEGPRVVPGPDPT